MIPADHEGKNIGYVEGQEIVIRKLQSLKGAPELFEDYEHTMEEVSDCCGSSAGACGEMSTGNTLALLTEALGFSLPGSSTTPGVMAEKIWEAKEVGQRIVDMALRKIRPSDIFNMNSLKNAIAVNMAICGGTNSLIHLQSYAHEVGVPCTLDTWDEISRKVPALCGVTPSGPYVLNDFHRAGGLPVLMKRIAKFLDRNCLTVTGKTVGKNLSKVSLRDSDVIRPIENPIWPEGALAILRGNLAPRGAVTRHTIVENRNCFKRPIRHGSSTLLTRLSKHSCRESRSL
jgi:dihydroxy-acid dehydratase